MDPSAEGEPYDKPTLVYVFGKISNNNKVSFVRNDNDAIRFIQDWLKESGSVIDYITSRRILALGCKFENWYFRFLWYILKRKFVTSQDRDGGGEVAISFNEEDFSDLRLKAYLEQNKISLLSDARQFMREVCEDFDLKLLTPEKKQALRSKMATGGIFISYKSENFAFAHKLFVQLKSLGYKVWFDCDKLHGGDFKKIIIDAIHKAKAVVTILSLEVAKDLEEGRTQEFYNDEWRWATQLDSDKEKVIPLAIDGYDLRSSYHKVFNKIISSASEKKVDGFDLMKAGKYTDFLNRIDELLKIK